MSTAVFKRCLVVVLIGLLVCGPGVSTGNAQAPVAGEAPPAAPLSAQQLEELVGRIALYPDDLVAIILPAATFPLDIVQAERFLQKVKQDKNLKPDQRWDESIRNLLNYPEVISMMSQDLDWTEDLGEAVVSQQKDVIKAIQAFRAKAASAGNLKSDDKQIVVQEKNVIQIVPADPQVIYVPQYQPTTVIVQQTAPPPPVYYPTPYPVYYYPYPPGAAFATGFFLGAATAHAVHWGAGSVYYGANYDDIQNDRANAQSQRQTAASQRQTQRQTTSSQQQTQRQESASERQGQRQDSASQARQQGQGGGGQAGGSQWQSQKKPGEVSQGRSSFQTAQARPGYGSGGASQSDAFGSGGRGSDATRDASRGAQSRGESPSTMERGGAQSGGGSRGGASASTMDKGGSGRGGGSASMGSGSRGGGGSSGGGAGGGGGGGGGSRGGGGGSRGGGRK